MKKLSSFLHFDTKGFLKDKELVFKGVSEWREYTGDKNKQGDVIGSKVQMLIMADNTRYEDSEEQELNVGEVVTIKTPRLKSEFEDCKKMATRMQIVNITKANVYGEFNNNLSLEGEVRPYQPKSQE
jgi:hypothetical protein